MPKITIKRATIPSSKIEEWRIVDHSQDVPARITAGINGGYCGLWNASVGYADDAGKWQTPRARVVDTWTEPTGHGAEQTRLAIIEW